MSKRQADYTLADILRLKPSWFRLKQSSPDALDSVLSQLHILCDHGYPELLATPVSAIFSDYDVTRSDYPITQALFEYRERLVKQAADRAKLVFTPQPSVLADVPHQVLVKLTEPNLAGLQQEATEMEKHAEEYEDEANSNLRNMQEYLNRVQQYETQAREKREAAEALRARIEQLAGKRDFSVIHSLQQFPQHYRLLGPHPTTPSSLVFLRTKRLTHTMSNAAGGVSLTMDMGYVAVVIDTRQRTVRTVMAADYIDYGSGPQHPHLSGSSICWGNVGHRAAAMLASGDYAGVVTLLEAVMTTYGGSPYRQFDWFYKKRNDRRVALATHSTLAPFMNDIARIVVRDCTDSTREHITKAILGRTVSFNWQTRVAAIQTDLNRIWDRLVAVVDLVGAPTRVTPAQMAQVIRDEGVRIPHLELLKRIGYNHFTDYLSRRNRALLLFLNGGSIAFTEQVAYLSNSSKDCVGAELFIRMMGSGVNFVTAEGWQLSDASINYTAHELYQEKLTEAREYRAQMAARNAAEAAELGKQSAQNGGVHSEQSHSLDAIAYGTSRLSVPVSVSAFERAVASMQVPSTISMESLRHTTRSMAAADQAYREDALARLSEMSTPQQAPRHIFRVMPDGTHEPVPAEWLDFTQAVLPSGDTGVAEDYMDESEELDALDTAEDEYSDEHDGVTEAETIFEEHEHNEDD